MIKKSEKLLAAMLSIRPEVVRMAIKSWAMAQVHKRKSNDDVLRGLGMDVVAVPDGQGHVGDGADLRPVMWVDGVAWALPPDIHRQRQAAAIERARKAKPATQNESANATEGIASVSCPQMHQGKPCGGSLNRKGVCPSCVTGKMGYKYRYTCESCGCDIVTREELR